MTMRTRATLMVLLLIVLAGTTAIIRRQHTEHEIRTYRKKLPEYSRIVDLVKRDYYPSKAGVYALPAKYRYLSKNGHMILQYHNSILTLWLPVRLGFGYAAYIVYSSTNVQLDRRHFLVDRLDRNWYYVTEFG